jgi:hypothetical protein
LLAPHRLLSIWSLPEVAGVVGKLLLAAAAEAEVLADCYLRHHLLLPPVRL